MSIYNIRVTRLMYSQSGQFELSVFPMGHSGTIPTRHINDATALKESLQSLGLGAEIIMGVFLDAAQSDLPVLLRSSISDTMAARCGWSQRSY